MQNTDAFKCPIQGRREEGGSKRATCLGAQVAHIELLNDDKMYNYVENRLV